MKLQRKQQPRPPYAGIAALLVVLLVLVGLVAIKVYSSGSSGGGSAHDNQPVPAPVLAALTQAPAATFDAVGKGSATQVPTAANGSPLTSDGKPELLYMGAEYCPYCAAERWSLIMALSRFGTWSGLNLMTSSATDVYPSTPTFTFVNAKYSSQYLVFTSVELTSNQPNGQGGYTTLQTPTAAQQQLLNTYDAPPYVASGSAGSIPFLDVANRYVQAGTAYSPQIIHGMDWQQIAQALGQPSSPQAQAIVGGANALTAAICAVTSNEPANVCTSPAVQHIQLKPAS